MSIYCSGSSDEAGLSKDQPKDLVIHLQRELVLNMQQSMLQGDIGDTSSLTSVRLVRRDQVMVILKELAQRLGTDSFANLQKGSQV